MEELRKILQIFVDSGWELISGVSQDWLDGKGDKAALVTAIQQADAECGSCGCDMDPLYKKALALLA